MAGHILKASDPEAVINMAHDAVTPPSTSLHRHERCPAINCACRAVKKASPYAIEWIAQDDGINRATRPDTHSRSEVFQSTGAPEVQDDVCGRRLEPFAGDLGRRHKLRGVEMEPSFVKARVPFHLRDTAIVCEKAERQSGALKLVQHTWCPADRLPAEPENPVYVEYRAAQLLSGRCQRSVTGLQ